MLFYINKILMSSVQTGKTCRHCRMRCCRRSPGRWGGETGESDEQQWEHEWRKKRMWGDSPGGRYSAKPLEFTRTLVLKVESKSSSALRKDRWGSDTTCCSITCVLRCYACFTCCRAGCLVSRPGLWWSGGFSLRDVRSGSTGDSGRTSS